MSSGGALWLHVVPIVSVFVFLCVFVYVFQPSSMHLITISQVNQGTKQINHKIGSQTLRGLQD